jgi:hypothetical protein
VREDEQEEDEADDDERAVPGEWSRCGGTRDAAAFDLDLQKGTFSTKTVSGLLNSVDLSPLNAELIITFHSHSRA